MIRSKDRCRRPMGFRSGTDPEVVEQVERGVPCSRESQETINPKDQMFLSYRLENQNHKQNNYCKQTKRKSFDLAESHRLFTVVNGEKTKTRETGKTQTEMPS